MPWTFGPAFLGGGVTATITISSNTFPGPSGVPPEEELDPIFFPGTLRAANYNLWKVMGEPIEPVNATILVESGSNLGSLLIPADFHPDSTFIITLTGSGRIVGCGKTGGFGGRTELGPTVQYPGGNGGNFPGGSNVGFGITSAFDFSLDADDGYVFGGGGGGGGGGYGSADESHTGGGGGGGAGWNVANGGGTHLGTTTIYSGSDGSLTGGGAGGTFFGSGGVGGAGGGFGQAGSNGGTGSGGPGTGSAGSNAIVGLVAITVTLAGAKNQATLESENRLLGGYTNVTFV